MNEAVRVISRLAVEKMVCCDKDEQKAGAEKPHKYVRLHSFWHPDP